MPFLKPTGRRQSARHFAVRLRFGGARADRGPGDELGEVLRHDRIERLGARRQPELGDVQQQFARQQNALLDVKRVVQVRIVDQSLPAHRGARLLEIHAHDRAAAWSDTCAGRRLQAVGILARRLHIVDGAGPDDDEQTRVAPLENRADHFARAEHGVRGPRRQRQPPLDLLGSRQQVARSDVDVLQSILNVDTLATSAGTAAYMDARMVQSSGKNLSSSALVRYDTPPVPPVPRL